MRAHNVKIVVGEDREIRVRLPSDFPLGTAATIVLCHAKQVSPQTPEDRAREFRAWLDALLQKLPRAPVLPDRLDREDR